MARIEQLVYGTFNFTNGFTLVSASPGLAEPLTRKIVRICDRWGSVRCADFGSAMYHLPLVDDTTENNPTDKVLHLVVKVVQQGTDRGGRRAWHHQVMVLSHSDYLQCGADCFSFDDVGLFKSRWFEIDQCGVMDVDAKVFPRINPRSIPQAHHQLIISALENLEAGRRVSFSTKLATPLVSKLFREVLCLLPCELRSVISLATFTFDQELSFDLCGLNDDSAPQNPEVTDLILHSSSSAANNADNGGQIPPNPAARSEVGKVLALFRAGEFEELDELLD